MQFCISDHTDPVSDLNRITVSIGVCASSVAWNLVGDRAYNKKNLELACFDTKDTTSQIRHKEVSGACFMLVLSGDSTWWHTSHH